MDSFVQDYKINVFNIAYLSKEIRNQFTSDFKIVADYFAEKDTPGYKPEDKEIKHVEGVLQMLRVFTDDTRYDMIKADVINREKRGGESYHVYFCGQNGGPWNRARAGTRN